MLIFPMVKKFFAMVTGVVFRTPILAAMRNFVPRCEGIVGGSVLFQVVTLTCWLHPSTELKGKGEMN
jgi:hypothetical protein